MLKMIGALFLVFMICGSLDAQSKSDTIEYIIREIKSCENEQMDVKDVEFSDGGNVCKIKTVVPGQLSERSFDLSLSDVDIFSSARLIKIGRDESIFVYSLMASPRNRSGGIRKNMSRSNGTEVILSNLLNGQKVKGIESAFAYLTEMVTGQKKTFKPSQDWP